mmetsp:Transcript_9618/g.21772  ORF Transcript_9618/g.21772 Transcript_9618/m.21772 type:complete len:227 (-) Transcript_9618:1865-2545(-)
MMKQRQASCRCCSSISRALNSQLSTRPHARPASSRVFSNVSTSSSVSSSLRSDICELADPSDECLMAGTCWIVGSWSGLKPWRTARSVSPICSSVSASIGEVFMVMALNAASLSMTFSRSSVSLTKSVSFSSAFRPCSSAVAHLAAMEVTDLKILEAMCFTPRSRFSRGRRTMAETELDIRREKPIIRMMITTMRTMLHRASIRFCEPKLNMARREPEAALISSSF